MVKKTTSNHNAPLLPTQHHKGQLNSSNFARFCLPLSAAFVPQPVKPVSACANQPLLELPILAHSNAWRAYQPSEFGGTKLRPSSGSIVPSEPRTHIYGLRIGYALDQDPRPTKILLVGETSAGD